MNFEMNIRLHTPSDHQTKNFWKSLNTISSLLAIIFSVSLLELSWIHYPLTCGISSPSLTSKPSSKLSFFNRHFHKSRRTMACVYECMCVCRLCLCLCVYLHKWCVLAHWVLLTERFVLYKSHPLLVVVNGRWFFTHSLWRRTTTYVKSGPPAAGN